MWWGPKLTFKIGYFPRISKEYFSMTMRLKSRNLWIFNNNQPYSKTQWIDFCDVSVRILEEFYDLKMIKNQPLYFNDFLCETESGRKKHCATLHGTSMLFVHQRRPRINLKHRWSCKNQFRIENWSLSLSKKNRNSVHVVLCLLS